MPNYIEFKDNNPEDMNTAWSKMVEEVRGSYFLPPTKKKICVDIGSNLGAFIHRASAEGAFEEIYGFEPAFQTYHASLSILRECEILKENVQIRNLAVTEESGQTLKLFDNGSGKSGNASLIEPPQIGQVEHCLTISLDDIFELLQVDHIDYLKMDCEGAEANVLAGCTRLEDITAIMIEAHLDHYEPIKNFLGTKGFYIFGFGGTPSESDKTKERHDVFLALNAKTYQADYKGYYNWDNTEKRTFEMMQASSEFPIHYEEFTEYLKTNPTEDKT